ncbi:MAG: hypothetical protein A2W93_11625 [Bacteroidetes bacterium GWF2_43_63]|nr:MAG: hypothetical protein A2W94_14495 [Bacteroidetes bacterium GWE2_42_42]OFY54919.1 MAG: hypothetical protein A2W93_11625 [Bacteroidetes bacterium GWF2_43_63]HCB63173.1 stress responsive protein [Bacteroidales bacterium]HCY22222.1 stress responsive protein [Bacteroidales bacterium]
MIKHIVLWKFHETAAGKSKAENMVEAKNRLLAMEGKIPGLLSIECGENITQNEIYWDLALYCTFDSEHSLRIYETHAAHEEVKRYLATVRDQRVACDYVM